MLAICQNGQGLDFAQIESHSDGMPVLRWWHTMPCVPAQAWASEEFASLIQSHTLGRYQCTTLLNQGDYQLLQVDAPDVPQTEQREALRWRLKDMIDYPIESVFYDSIALPEAVMPGRAAQLFAAVTQQSVLQPLIAGFNTAGLQLKSIDLPEFAIRNVAARFEEANRGLAFLVFGEQSALLVFTYGGELFAMRRIEVGAAQLQNAVPERREQLAERIVLELQRTLDGVDRQFSAITLSRMMVSLPQDCGLEPYFRNNLYIHFDAVDLTEVIDLSAVPALQDLEQQRLAMRTIGAALREELAA